MTRDLMADPCSAYYRFSQERLVMEVVSFRAIEEGEEITMSCESHCPGFWKKTLTTDETCRWR